MEYFKNYRGPAFQNVFRSPSVLHMIWSFLVVFIFSTYILTKSLCTESRSVIISGETFSLSAFALGVQLFFHWTRTLCWQFWQNVLFDVVLIFRMNLRSKASKASSCTAYWHGTHHLYCPKHTRSCMEWRQILARSHGWKTSPPESFHFYWTHSQNSPALWSGKLE